MRSSSIGGPDAGTFAPWEGREVCRLGTLLDGRSSEEFA